MLSPLWGVWFCRWTLMDRLWRSVQWDSPLCLCFLRLGFAAFITWQYKERSLHLYGRHYRLMHIAAQCLFSHPYGDMKPVYWANFSVFTDVTSYRSIHLKYHFRGGWWKFCPLEWELMLFMLMGTSLLNSECSVTCAISCFFSKWEERRDHQDNWFWESM